MALKSVRAQIDSVWYDLTLNSETGAWEASVAAPSATSYGLPGGYYPVTLEATSSSGKVVTVTTADSDLGDALKLVVVEKVKPNVTITGPINVSYVTNGRQPITFQLRDETGGSGVNLETLSMDLDGIAYGSTADGMSVMETDNGYDVTYTPPTALSDGTHTVSVTVSDNDGNTSDPTATAYRTITTMDSLNLITDRTSEDVSHAKYLNSKWVGGVWTGTDDELAEWKGYLKGFYNNEDMNRVEYAVSFLLRTYQEIKDGLDTLRTSLNVAGEPYFTLPFEIPVLTIKDDWLENEKPSESDLERYLSNVDVVSDLIPIEKALLYAYNAARALETQKKDMIEATAKNYVYSGEVYAGEI